MRVEKKNKKNKGIIYLLSPIILSDKYTHIYEKVCMIVWKYGLGELYLQRVSNFYKEKYQQ